MITRAGRATIPGEFIYILISEDTPMKSIRLFVLFFVLSLVIPVMGTAQTFKAEFAGQQTVDGENAVAITFSEKLDTKQNLDPYFSLRTGDGAAVEGAWILAKDPQVVYFTHVEPDTTYKIQISQGLKAKSGKLLSDATVFEVTTRQAEPMISFGSQGFILASKLSRGLPVDSLNIAQADIDFFRVKPGKAGQFKEVFGSGTSLYYYESQNLKKVADLVYSGRWDLDIKKDLRTQVNIPITHIKELETPGIYFAVLKGAGQYDYSYNSTWFTISDLGVHARVYKGSVDFLVQSLETASPIEDARVEGFDKKGKSLFAKQTNAMGKAVAAGSFETLSLVMVTRGKQVSLLPMDVPAMDLSEFKMGMDPFRPVDLFVYGPRDIYRPGETVVIDGLLRNQDGAMTPGLPLKAKVIQPDGRMIREFTWKPGPQNHYNESFQLPADAVTGKWRVEFAQGKIGLKAYPFVVAEFLPERMKLTIIDTDKDTEDDVLTRETGLVIELQGDFLYGAPAANSRANALVHIKPARELFKDKWPGVEFGDVKNLANRSFTTEDIRLDDKGWGAIPVENQWSEVTSPHWITANASLYDSGGRPVVRNRSWQVWPAPTLVGIRSLSATDPDDSGQVKNDSTAQFEVMLTDVTGKRLPAQGLKVTVVREHREYYWEFKNGEWHWGSYSQHYPVDRFSLNIPDSGKAQVSIPVKWGGYRLEILNPATGFTSAFNIWAGWRRESKGSGVMNRPDRVDITLDKPAYGPGDTAKITVKAPEGGKGYLFVDSDRNELIMPITLPAEGKIFELPINPDWNRHDLYISALVVRPGESRTGNLPKRSVGLTALPLDRENRKLAVNIQAPNKIEPNQTLKVPVNITSTDGEALGKTPSKIWVTLAAVDVGILNLTGFETPDPFDYFFQDRRYGVQLQDLYQKLIEANEGVYAKQRFGGDAPSLTRGGDRPATDVQIVALHHQAIEADSQGKANFSLDIPDFEGSLRLMAVAHTKQDFGAGDLELIVASPLVVQATMPRFLATKDSGEVVLDFHNLTQISQKLTLDMGVRGPVQFQGNTSQTQTQILALEPGSKRSVRLPISAGQNPGRANITCKVKGLVVDGKNRSLERTWFLETRPAFPPVTRVWKKQIQPGTSFKIDSKALNNLVAKTIGIQAGFGIEPPINLSDHVSQLLAYPYGCLEQTVSGLFPHVLLSGDEFAGLGLKTGSMEDKAKKISLGIQRLVEKQKSSGGFGLWSSKSPENAWLTAYAAHFLINAHDAGYEIPQTAVKKALERLVVYVRQTATIPYAGYVDRDAYRAAVRSYAAFVLARVRSLGLGDARSVYQYAEKYGKGPLCFIQAGVALSLAGDRHQAVKAFDRAIKTQRETKKYIGDYGSDIRDFAASYYFLATYFPDYQYKALFLHELDAALDKQEWLSTQERNALVMAGAARLNTQGKPWKAQLRVGSQSTGISGTQPGQAVFTQGVAAKGFEIKNTGKSDLYAHVVMAGYPNEKPKPSSHGVKISRRYLDTKGQPMDVQKVKSGDRILVELRVRPEKRMPHALVVDMLPAGVELEDPNLSGAFIIDDVLVDKKLVIDWQSDYTTAHTEFRDDRFVAALDIRRGQTCRIFYLVRVVSPGIFRVPPSLVEDMYRPYIRSVGSAISRMEVVSP